MVGDFDVDSARERFQSTYPFHPALLSVFERKWQSLPRFQKTRGMLRLLALWVSHAYKQGFKGAHPDPLIGLGTAPLDDPYFRAAMFEQLGNNDLEGPVTTDIAGKKDAHALELDREANGRGQEVEAAPESRDDDSVRVKRGHDQGRGDRARDPPGGRRARPGHRQRRIGPRSTGR